MFMSNSNSDQSKVITEICDGEALSMSGAGKLVPALRGQKNTRPETVWRWAGYKDVTIVNTDSPQIKYVVAHLRDRDGFCDASNFNNTLGVPIKFEMDAGGGTILDAADIPFTINGTKRFATATSPFPAARGR